MIVAGIGCRSGIEAHQVLAAIDATLAFHAVERTQIDALASLPQKRNEPALAEVAGLLGRPLLFPDEAALKDTEQRILTRSKRSIAATGHGSASEAAALAAAGPAARLFGPRIATGSVMCALAKGDGRP